MNFSWDRFDATFLIEVIKASEYAEEYSDKLDPDDIDMLAGCMLSVCEYPDRRFIVKYRSVIEHELFKYYPQLMKKMCSRLRIPGSTFNDKLINMSRKKMTNGMIDAYLSTLMEINKIQVRDNELSKFRYTIPIDMNQTEVENVSLYDFQKKAVECLTNHYIIQDKKNGFLVMPTGSGKSRTATYFLIKEMVSRGYQILWIAHRHMLIDQAADCFYWFAGLAKVNKPDIKNYRISCISGNHLRISMVGKHEIIVASISSICRNKEHLRRILGNKVMIVVDEAHHALAPTYRETIQYIRKHRKNTKLLGLTATPVRSNDDDSLKLRKLFDNELVYSISMSNLIVKGILSNPEYHRIETGEDFEPTISIDEEKYLRRFGELPESLVNKIAESASRNKVIIQEYLDHKEMYGKTLFFAMNVVHCRTLAEELSRKGVKCGCIYSGNEENEIIIDQFKTNKLEALVNVNIMTEGSDVPDIQTVFLTRPTSSEGLLMQMIGRGMRGKYAGGTETIHIVDFHDKWSVWDRWKNPEWILDEEIDGKENPKKEYKATHYESYSWELCKSLYKQFLSYQTVLSHSVLLPVAWYTLIDQEGEEERMLILENQMPGLVAMMKDKKSWINDSSLSTEDIIKRYFSGFAEPPQPHEMELLIYNVRHNEDMPNLHLFEKRKDIDPYYVAKRAAEEQKDPFLYAGEIYDQNEMARDLYDSREAYIMKVCEAKVYDGKVPVVGLKVEELPIELIPFDRTPCYDLQEIYKEVVDEMFGGTYEGISGVEWTDKAYKGYYGIYYYRDNSIKINCVLNSKDVPKEAVKYVLYHELLHRDLQYHDKEFRRREHLYPNYAELDYFLDGKMGDFEITEW